MRHLTVDPNVEVIGTNVLGIVNNLNVDEMQTYLEKHGLVDVKPDKWYPAQQWLDVMNDLRTAANFTQNLIAAGMSVAQHIELPPELEKGGVVAFLHAWDDIYQMQHRGGDIGEVKVETLAPTHIKTIHRHIYPDELTYGVGYGFARRLVPVGTHVAVFYDENLPRLDEGDGEQTIIHFKW